MTQRAYAAVNAAVGAMMRSAAFSSFWDSEDMAILAKAALVAGLDSLAHDAGLDRSESGVEIEALLPRVTTKE